MMDIKLERINDQSFVYETKDHFSVKIHFKNKSLNPETCCNLAKKVAALYANRDKAELGSGKTRVERFRFAKKNWKVSSGSRVSLFIRIIRLFLPFFHLPGADNTIELHVNRSWFRGKKSKKDKAAKAKSKCEHEEWRKATKQDFARSNWKRRIDQSVSVDDFRKGVRAQIKAQESSYELYQDPFTDLTRIAFQNLESDFVSHDESTPETCDYRIIYHEGHFKLVHKDHKSSDFDPSCHEEAVRKYRTHIINTMGDKKAKEIALRYKIEWDSLKQLTPEHVYRFNVGSTKLYDEDLSQGKISYSPEKIRAAMSGRGFHKQEKIGSAYTRAGMERHKPWVDDQELMHVFEQLISASSWESYMELLAHIVSKKHLAERIGDEFRVKMLIPTPSFLQANGTPQWYIVRNCISNGFTHGYIFEPAEENSLLPIILLDRSTTTGRYAFHAERTIMNDLNHFYSPGHLGLRLLEKEYLKVLKSKLMPIWVGYHDLAKKSLKAGAIEEATQYLKKSVQALEEEEKEKYRTLNLREILQKHDVLFESLYLISEGIYLKKQWNREVAQFSPLLTTFINKYINLHFDDYKVNYKEEEKDAEKLLKLLETIPQVKGLSKEWYEEAIADIKNHIIAKNAKGRSFYLRSDSGIEKKPLLEAAQEYEKIKDFVTLVEQGGASIDITDHLRKDLIEVSKSGSTDLIQILSSKIEWLAYHRGEALSQKKAQGICGAGHSLGAASIQSTLVEFLIKAKKMPIPGSKVCAYLFDSPAVNREDNLKFKEYGIKHHDLFKKENVQFELNYSFEKGDPVPRGGEEFLGATFTDQETEDLGKWLSFKGTVYGRMSTSTVFNTLKSQFVHDTLFQEGKEGIDYTATSISPKMLGILNAYGRYTDLSPEEAKKQYHQIYSEVFEFPTVLEGILREETRKSVGRVWKMFRKAVLSNPSFNVLPPLQDVLSASM